MSALIYWSAGKPLRKSIRDFTIRRWDPPSSLGSHLSLHAQEV
jgi:hypothetical protein